MRHFALALSMLATTPALAQEERAWDLDAQPTTMVLRDAMVLEGDAFVRRDLYVRDGRIQADEPRAPDVVLDLAGRYVIPPLGEAHTHRFSTKYDAEGARDLFLERGVFYALNCCCPSTAREESEGFANVPGGVDVVWSNGGFTCPGGHPVRLYEGLHTNVYRQSPDTFREQNENNTFYEVASVADIEAKWPAFLDTRPDLAKILLLHSDEYDERLGDERYYGGRGIRADLAREVVERATDAGLRTGAHVENAADFGAAVDAGVGLTLHTPGYGILDDEETAPFLISNAQARRAAEAGVVHVSTACIARNSRSLGVITENLRTLREAGVPIALGSDAWNGPDVEIQRLREMGIFTDAELLTMWSRVTPRAIFPNRAVGSLAPGSEASFLVLDEDPSVDIAAVGGFTMAVKDGALILPPPPEPSVIGSVAPDIEIEHWIQVRGMDGRGGFEPLTSFERGTTYVLDFWATWCAPCVAGFEKISDIQDRYTSRDVRVIGITEESLPHVVAFMRGDVGEGRTHFDRATFEIASDPDASSLEALIPEALRGIRPIGVIIDAEGRIAWIGNPGDEMVETLDAVLDGTWDLDAFAGVFAERLSPLEEKERIMAEEDWSAARARFWNDSLFLTQIAFGIGFNYSGDIENRDPDVAESFARRAVELTGGRNPYSLHTLARACFNKGRIAEAVETQRRAVDVRNETDETPNYKGYYESTLAEYEGASDG